MLHYTVDGRLARLTARRAEKKNAYTQAMWTTLRDVCLQLAAAHGRDATDGAASVTGGGMGGGDAARAAVDPRRRGTAATAIAGGAAAPGAVSAAADVLRADGCADEAQAAPATLRALLLQGEGGAFCAGADIDELQLLLADPQALALNNAVVGEAQTALQRLPLPTLALIDGPCFGGGFGIAAACDFRIATPRSRFAVTPARLGLLYSIADSRRLLNLLGASHTRRLLLRGEQIDAATALAWGAVDAVVEADALQQAGAAWAADVTSQSPTSMAGIKATLAFLEGSGGSTEAQLRAAYDAAFGGADFAEGSAAFRERRRPRF